MFKFFLAKATETKSPKTVLLFGAQAIMLLIMHGNFVLIRICEKVFFSYHIIFFFQIISSYLKKQDTVQSDQLYYKFHKKTKC